MKSSPLSVPLTTALALAGCGTTPPLYFADTTSFGIRLGTETTTAGGSVSVGYKAHSIAVVPVSAARPNGEAGALRGKSHDNKDALSVFAVFRSSAEGANAPVVLGQMFSTGTAAQYLTEGFACRHQGGAPCIPTKEELGPAAASAQQAGSFADRAAASAEKALLAAKAAQAAAGDAKNVSSGGAPAAFPAPPALPPSANSLPLQRSLVYARSDVIGIDIGASTAEQGIGFTLGYTTHSLAVVPVFTRGADGKPTHLINEQGDPSTQQDAYSVLGQFNANTKTKALGFGLERYFATGIAAQNLARGLRAAIAAEGASAAKAGGQQ